MNKGNENKICCDIENYISDKDSICREERQYALFLCNVLRYYKRSDGKVKNIFDACGIPSGAEIENVFYEAAFMRDYFHKSRDDKKDSFNKKLISFVSDKKFEYTGDEINLGRNKFECKDLPKDKMYTAKWMMEAKPDLAVIYKKENEKYLLFIECKFESGESIYKAEDFSLSQRQIQWKIAQFLCKEYWNGDITISDEMEEERSRLVTFVRLSENPKKTPENPIYITELIKLNEDIFKREK